MRLKLTQIDRDVDLSPRKGISAEVAEDYAACFEQLPPIVVFKVPDREKFLLADGWHRCRAADILKIAEVEAEVRYGAYDDALEYSLLANARHGRPLSRQEKQTVVERLLKLHPERANAWLAQDVGVSYHTVITLRERLEDNLAIARLEEFMGRDGKLRPRSIEQPSRNSNGQQALDLAEDAEQSASESEDVSDPAPDAQLSPVPEPDLVPTLGCFILGDVHNIDCIAGLSGIPEGSIDLVFADPPYNLGKNYGDSVNDRMPVDDYFVWCMQWFVGAYRALRPGGAFYVMHYPEVAARWKMQLDSLLTFQRWLTWVYPANVGHSSGNWTRAQRTILYYTKGTPAYFVGDADPQPYKNPDDRRVAHIGKRGTVPYDWWEYNLVKNVSPEKTKWPNQLPIELLKRIILTSCPPEGITIDPFMGSGTTAEACTLSGRSWLGFDTESEACNITKERVLHAIDAKTLV